MKCKCSHCGHAFQPRKFIGGHRVACVDSTIPAEVAELAAGEKAVMIHADPPYGMGKEIDGVENDNLTGAKLDAFQMKWWRAWRPWLNDNGSAYVWGNAPALWSLWYRGGLAESEALTLRNEIVWDKIAIAGMASPLLTQFPEASERCLFFQIGRHVFLVGQTKDDYWEGWEPIRVKLVAELEKAQMTAKRVREVCGNHMHGHWFGKSQWCMIDRKNYDKLAAAAVGTGAFQMPFEDLHKEYKGQLAVFKGEVRDPRREGFNAARPFFDNAHEPMHDVWQFSRVTGEEREGHATPKPVAMMERAIKSSSRPGELTLEPFLGSGSTLIAAERTGRRCFGAEITEAYADVCVARYQNYTRTPAVRLADGMTFDQAAKAARH